MLHRCVLHRCVLHRCILHRCVLHVACCTVARGLRASRPLRSCGRARARNGLHKGPGAARVLESTLATSQGVEGLGFKGTRYFGAISYVHELMKVSDMDKIMRWPTGSARCPGSV
jgi:hypothetical protein